MPGSSRETPPPRMAALSLARLRANILVSVAFFVVGLLIIQGFAYWSHFNAALDEGERRAENLALILKEHVEQTAAAADAALRQIAIQSRRIGGPTAPATQWQPLLDAAFSGVSGVGSISIIDAAGTIRHSTMAGVVGQSRGDRFLFKRLREGGSARVVADAPFRSPATGTMLMPIGRRLLDETGRFAGAAVATIDPALLRELYRSVDTGPGGKIRVIHPSGVLFFGEPSAADPAGRSVGLDPVFRAYRRGMTAGTILGPLAPGGPSFISAFRTTGSPELVISVALARADVLADWRRDLAIGATLTLLLCAALLFAAVQLRGQFAARQTAERIAERRTREMTLAQSIAGLGLISIDMAAGTVRLSPQFNRNVGWPEARDTASLDAFLALAAEPDRARLRTAFAACVEEGGSYRLECAFRRADGSPRVFWSEGFWHNGSDGGAPEIVAFCQDVTDRRTFEERLLQAQKMEAIGQLTGGIAHDFNNLLTVLMGGAELLAERLENNPPLKRQAETMVGAAQRGATLTARLLAFARRQPLAPSALDVNRLLADMDGLMRRAIGEHIEIELVRGAGLWPAQADRAQLETAILNLAVNARDAMPGGGRLTIETANAHIDRSYAEGHADLAPGQYVMIAVTDTGMGMPPDIVARAFEPFFTTKDVGKGTGLGLSMVYGFAKQSGGHAKIYSEPGKGTTVRLYLPRAAGEAMPEQRPTVSSVPGGSERILVVEDDPDVRAHAEQQLCALGYAVSSAESGPAALRLLQRGDEFDLLFSDIVMPGGMNGRELAEAARKLRPQLKILFASGYAENAVIRNGDLAHGVAMLQKPYRREDLAARVRAALDAAPGA
ncbi:MAG: response regulator [Rhodospirillaceae bacterium]|nr:response regulator [Rhodospirillaceae bacterium]